MFCEKCGKEIKDGDKFCPYCGAENEINKEEPSHDIPPDFSVKGAGKKKKGAVIAIAVLVIIVAIGIFKCSSTVCLYPRITDSKNITARKLPL